MLWKSVGLDGPLFGPSGAFVFLGTGWTCSASANRAKREVWSLLFQVTDKRPCPLSFNLLHFKQGEFGRNSFACLAFNNIVSLRINLFMFQYKILLYSLDGRLLSTYQAYEWSLGIKSIAWSPSSQFLAIGSYDEKVRNRFIFSLLFSLFN